MPQRTLSPYEQTHLARHGLDPLDFDFETYGEMPVEYITGKADFYGHEFDVTEDVLIPRVETEEIIPLILNHISQSIASPPLQIADIGTGSGAIGITLKLELDAQKIETAVTISDVSTAAVEVAQTNAQKLGASVMAITSDLLRSFPPDWQADILVANLPYIPSGRVEHLEKSVKDFEPHLALDGGEQGLSLIQQFLLQALTHLKPKGSIFLEADHTHQTHELQQAILAEDKFHVSHLKDSFGQPRFFVLTTQQK